MTHLSRINLVPDGKSNLLSIFPQMALQPPVDQDLPIIQASLSHSDTPQSVGLRWTNDQPNAETTHNTQQETDIQATRGIRTCNSSKRVAAKTHKVHHHTLLASTKTTFSVWKKEFCQTLRVLLFNEVEGDEAVIYLFYLFITIKKKAEALVVASKETGLEVNADKNKYMAMSRE